jgi:hypothetical protein
MSCGCYNKERLKLGNNRKHDPRTATARYVWQTGYKDCDFETFLELSQQPCHYCGRLPHKTYSIASSKKGKCSVAMLQDGNFIYNGLDRVDNSKGHSPDNVVPCCYRCNTAKHTMTQEEFLELVTLIHKTDRSSFNVNEAAPLQQCTYDVIPSKTRPRKYHPKISSARQLWKNHYKECEFDTFLALSQMNCYYCGRPPQKTFNLSNSKKWHSAVFQQHGDFTYNGLDRVDSSKGHYKDNVVPCCCDCNWAKNDMPQEEFFELVDLIYCTRTQKL